MYEIKNTRTGEVITTVDTNDEALEIINHLYNEDDKEETPFKERNHYIIIDNTSKW